MNCFTFSKMLCTKVLNICIRPLEVVQLIYILYVNSLHGKEADFVLFYLQESQNKPFQALCGRTLWKLELLGVIV